MKERTKKSFISIAACSCLALSLNLSAAESVKLEAIEVNSVGDNISESGIDEGFLTKNVQNGILAGKKVIDLPYQINTITKETMNHQGVTGFEEAVKYFPSAQVQMRGGTTVGRPQTRGFEGSVVGNVFWDGFYSVSTTAIPMAMFESLQIQNGIAGSLYGTQRPVGTFNYTRKRPVDNEHTIWSDYTSRSNFGLGLDSSMKFEKFGYRTVFYGSDGAKQVKGSNYQRRLASAVLEFYPTDALTLETAASYYEHNTRGFAGLFALYVKDGRIRNDLALPKAVDNKTKGLGQPYGGMKLKTTMLSAKFKYYPLEDWYFEGGFAWQRADRDIHSIVNRIKDKNGNYDTYHSGGATAAYRFDLPSGYLKAVTDFDTWGLNHDFIVQLNGYRYDQVRYKNVSTNKLVGSANINDPKIFPNTTATRGSGLYKLSESYMTNVSLLDDITINENFSLMLSASNAWMKVKSRGVGKTADPLKKTYDESGLSYGASLIYKPNQNTSFYLTYADSLLEGEQKNNLDGSVTILKPYRSKQYEIGAKTRVGELDLSAAVFKIQRPIAYQSTSSGTWGMYGEQVNHGFEFTAGGKLTNDLSVFGGVALIDPKFKNPLLKDAHDKVVNGVPKVNSNLLFDYVVPNTNKLAFSANFHYTGKMYLDDLNTRSTPSFFVTDLGVRYASKALLGKQTTIRFNVNNVFNKKYWAGMYPASADGAGTSSSVLGVANGLSLGDSRTFMLSAEIKF
ncbi:TonB-dependent receptor [Campylobacter sp.]|uniref:TonB-dependent receptor n=1 Tax=Campylobacter sp. TaxID=205 RepID=UPI0026F7619B|nr:TonB-dependent receptor [Campylobacter sp.]